MQVSDQRGSAYVCEDRADFKLGGVQKRDNGPGELTERVNNGSLTETRERADRLWKMMMSGKGGVGGEADGMSYALHLVGELAYMVRAGPPV
jgi:hypothetical protein